jgi:hypothetical protein
MNSISAESCVLPCPIKKLKILLMVRLNYSFNIHADFAPKNQYF